MGSATSSENDSDKSEVISEDENKSTSTRRKKNPSVKSPKSKQKSIDNDSQNHDTKIKKIVQKSPLPTNYDQQRQNSSNKLLTSTMPVQKSIPNANIRYIPPIVNTRRLPSPPLVKLVTPQSPAILKRDVYLSPQLISTDTPAMKIPTASAFERAPMVQLNYVVKSSENKSAHAYESDRMTIMRRTSSQPVQHGNRWYDYDYHTKTKLQTTKYV